MYFFLCITLLFGACYAQIEPKIEDTNICIIRNGYYKIDGSCDAYVECVKHFDWDPTCGLQNGLTDYQPTRMLCPDGLNYNPQATWPTYPCSYPADVPCNGRGVSQPPKPTAECPRQHGFFLSPLSRSNDCGQYRLCSDGYAFDMYCPYGLAFDINRARCDWPEFVPGCNPKEFLSFACPAVEYDRLGNPLISNFRYEGDCYMFYSCQSGRARLLSCDPGFAFDANLGRCVNADQVNCELYVTPEENVSNAEDE